MLRFQVIGNLGADAQVKVINGRNAVVFNVAHTDRWSDESGSKHEVTTWVSCILNGDGGRLLEYLKRGTGIFVEGAGSTRIYSSPKERKMVAGLNLTVDHIELVGGKTEDIPHDLADANGTLWQTAKAYYIPQEGAKAAGATKKDRGVLYDTRGGIYEVDAAGFVYKTVQEQEAKQDDAPFGEANDLAQQITNSK